MFRKFAVPIILVILGLSGCAGMGPNQQGGVLIGGATGGLIGSQVGKGNGRVAGGIIGALIGALIGNNIGSYMDQQDQMRMQSALERQRIGRPYTWRNDHTGYSYALTPTRTWQQAGYPCREYAVKGNIGGQWQTVYGKACRQPDGSWQAMDGSNNQQQPSNYDEGAGEQYYNAPPSNYSSDSGYNPYRHDQQCREGYLVKERDWRGRLHHRFCKRCNGYEQCGPLR